MHYIWQLSVTSYWDIWEHFWRRADLCGSGLKLPREKSVSKRNEKGFCDILTPSFLQTRPQRSDLFCIKTLFSAIIKLNTERVIWVRIADIESKLFTIFGMKIFILYLKSCAFVLNVILRFIWLYWGRESVQKWFLRKTRIKCDKKGFCDIFGRIFLQLLSFRP